MGSKIVKTAQRTEDFIVAFYKDGASAHLGPVDITNAPWHSGYQNQKLQKHHTAIVGNEELKKGGLLEGCGVWEYKVPDAGKKNIDVPFGINESFTVVQTDDKRRIPRAYRDSATYTVSIEKMKAKFGDNFPNVYYNLQDKAVIMSQPESIRKKAFDRFLQSQLKEVQSRFKKEPVEWVEGLTAALTAQYVDDYKTGEWLNYSEDVIGQFPGGVALEEKTKAVVQAHSDKKKEQTGLSKTAISYAIGGSAKDAFVPDAGIRIITYSSDLSIAKLLRAQQDDMSQFMGDLIGAEEKANQGIYVAKEVADATTGMSNLAILYNGYSSENVGEVRAAFENVIRQAITNPSVPSDSFTRTDFIINDDEYKATTSQVKNAIDRYNSHNGTWVTKNIDKPIKIETATLDESLMVETTTSERQMGE